MPGGDPTTRRADGLAPRPAAARPAKPTRLRSGRVIPALFAAWLSAGLAACAVATRPAPPAPPAETGEVPILLVRHAWHTGLLLPADRLPADWPLRPDPAVAVDWIEVAFGDALFYPAPDPPLWMAIRAALWPTPAVLSASGRRGPLANLPGEELLELRVDPSGFERLRRAIEADLERDAAGRLRLLARDVHGQERFWAARPSFHLLRTCNVWTAQRLAEAGVPVRPVLGAGELIAQLEPLARRLRRMRREPVPTRPSGTRPVSRGGPPGDPAPRPGRPAALDPGAGAGPEGCDTNGSRAADRGGGCGHRRHVLRLLPAARRPRRDAARPARAGYRHLVR